MGRSTCPQEAARRKPKAASSQSGPADEQRAPQHSAVAPSRRASDADARTQRCREAHAPYDATRVTSRGLRQAQRWRQLAQPLRRAALR